MKALIQRVSRASVDIDGETVGKIGPGLLILLGVGKDSQENQISKLVEKIINLRIFADDSGKFNLSLLDKKGEVLVVSQFTLYADCSHGRRPDFFQAGPPEQADKFYQLFCQEIASKGLRVQTGKFGAHMQVHLVNDGPVTIMLG